MHKRTNLMKLLYMLPFVALIPLATIIKNKLNINKVTHQSLYRGHYSKIPFEKLPEVPLAKNQMEFDALLEFLKLSPKDLLEDVKLAENEMVVVSPTNNTYTEFSNFYYSPKQKSYVFVYLRSGIHYSFASTEDKEAFLESNSSLTIIKFTHSPGRKLDFRYEEQDLGEH